MRQKIKSTKSKSPINMYKGLGISENEKAWMEDYLLKLFKKHQHISDVIEELWNNEKISDEWVCIGMIGIGRAQAQNEMLEQSKDILGRFGF